MAFYNEQVTIPIGLLYLFIGFAGCVLAAIGAVYYRTRRYYEQFDFDLPPRGYESYSKKKVNW
jgi:hypothetical protein